MGRSRPELAGRSPPVLRLQKSVASGEERVQLARSADGLLWQVHLIAPRLQLRAVALFKCLCFVWQRLLWKRPGEGLHGHSQV